MPSSSRRRWLYACVITAMLALVAGSSMVARGHQSESADQVRALWVTRATMTSPSAINRMVSSAKEAGFNTIVVQVRGRGDAYYASTLEPRAAELASRPGFDPLAETIAVARRAGVRVHAWVVVNLVSSAVQLPSSRDHIVYRHPEWLMVPRELAAEMLAVNPRSPAYVGRLARWARARSTDVEGLYVSPIHPAAAKHVADVVAELAQRYQVDGVHLDYIRYPNESFDYSRSTLQQFKQMVVGDLSDEDRRRADDRERLDPLAYTSLFTEQWEAFRRARLTAVVMRVRTALKAVRPTAALSAAVVPDSDRAHTTRLQDWRTWLDQSLLDVVCPMAYTQDADIFAKQIAEAQTLAAGTPVWAGIGAYRLSTAETLQHIEAARRLKANGVILFSYDALTSPPNGAASFAQLGRAAFGAGSN